MAHLRSNRRRVSKELHIQRHASSALITERYEMLHKIGSGSFGSVYLAMDKSSGKERACKVVNVGTHQAAYAVARREVDLLSQMDHPCIVSLYEYSVESSRGHLTMILEYVAGGSAYDLLCRATRPLSEVCVGRLIQQLLVALRYCHANRVIHRDVKPENLMLYQRLDGHAAFDCKLIDFGCAAKIPDESQSWMSCQMQDERGTRIGTPAYMAPEVVRKAPCSAQSDIWSVGVCALQLLTRELMFGCPGPENDTQRVFDAICRYTGMGELQDFLAVCAWWEGRSSKVSEFLESVMKVDPCRRPTAEEALASAWMLHAAPAASGMTQELIFSLSQYVAAPEIVRCCLFAVAARGRHCVKELQQLRDAFLALDMDGDGFVTKEDMQEALGGIFGFQLTSLLGFVPELDIEALFAAADLDQSGSLGFTEFVAACLYSRYASLDTLIREAFQALDHNGEGIVSMQDIRHLFREQDLRFLSKLPDSRPFTIDEWSSCIQSSERKVWVSSPKAKNKTAKSKAGFLVDLFAPDLFSCREQAGFLADTVVPALFTCKGAWSDEGDYEFITVH